MTHAKRGAINAVRDPVTEPGYVVVVALFALTAVLISDKYGWAIAAFVFLLLAIILELAFERVQVELEAERARHNQALNDLLMSGYRTQQQFKRQQACTISGLGRDDNAAEQADDWANQEPSSALQRQRLGGD